MNETLIQSIKELFTPILNDAGADLVKLALRQQGRTWGLDVFVDKPAGGISIAECALINRKLFALVEASRCLGDDFTLEVSSPGLDWPLTTRKDFLRVPGRPLRIFLVEPVAGKLEYAGTLAEVRAGTILINFLEQGSTGADPAAETLEIPLVKIRKAVQII